MTELRPQRKGPSTPPQQASESLRIPSAGFRYAHARKTAQDGAPAISQIQPRNNAKEGHRPVGHRAVEVQFGFCLQQKCHRGVGMSRSIKVLLIALSLALVVLAGRNLTAVQKMVGPIASAVWGS